MSVKSFTSIVGHIGAVVLTVYCCFFGACLFLSSNAAPPALKKHAVAKSANNVGATAYLNNLRQNLLKEWQLIDGKNTVTLEAIVNLDGSMSELKSTSSSDTNALAIESAMNDVEKCKPLPPLPATYKHSCKLTLTFHSNVDPHGDSDSDLTTAMTEIQDIPVPKQ